MLTPEEIHAREFLVSLRGYDRDEVHSFLEQIAGQMRDLQSQLETLQVEQPPPPILVPLVPPVDDAVVSPESSADPKPFFEDLGQTTQRIVEAAYESAAEIQRKARSRAGRELEEARSQAAKLIAEGERRREVIEGLVEMLEERRAVLAQDLRGIAKIVDQMLADFAPREGVPASEWDEGLADQDDDVIEAELASATEESVAEPGAQPTTETEAVGQSADDDPADASDAHGSAAAKGGSSIPFIVSRPA
jgi:cell division initiation protein